jgi:hypothetical protein
VCPHFGQATPTTPNPRVMVGGMAVSTMAPAYSVTGCAPPGSPPPPPCTIANWTTAAMRVTAGGDPVVLLDSQAMTNFPAPLQIVSTQTRVQAQ